ncbi:unnamed protein product [Linum trigynum]|uniref:Disease resistance N-terminal domain-containing protein n=1 Tax=Linum trigynum TaxID=586398 RepID=A0AAV2DG73_9ROSI
MAETALFSIAGVVLKKLGYLAAEQASLLWGLSSEIPKLTFTVSSIQAVLLDAEEKSGHNHQIQLWLHRLKQVLYDADDLLDDLSTEARQREQMEGHCVMNEVYPTAF